MSGKAIVCEPGLYAFGGFGPESDVSDKFSRFEKSVMEFMEFAKLNDLRLLCTRDLFDRATALFPYNVLHEELRKGRGRQEDLASLLNRFLSQYLQSPQLEYSIAEDSIQEIRPNHISQGVYQDEDLWLMWRDLVVQVALVVEEQVLRTRDLMAAESDFSCFPPTSEAMVLQLTDGQEENFGLFRMMDCPYPAGLLNYQAHQSLTERKGPNDPDTPDFNYEKTGHILPRSLQKVLERTAIDCKDFTVLMATEKRDQKSPCKLICDSQDSGVDQIRYVVSDGDWTMKGYFKTLAQNLDEQAVALELLRREFVRHCRKERFTIAPEMV